MQELVRDDVVAAEQRDGIAAARRPGVLPTQQLGGERVGGRDAVVQRLPRRHARLRRRRPARQHPQRPRLLVAADEVLLLQRLPAHARRLRQLLPRRVYETSQ